MNYTIQCAKCKYPHPLDTRDLQGKTSVSFTCTGCGTPQEAEIPQEKRSREESSQAAAADRQRVHRSK